MAVLTKGVDFTTGDQVTAANLDNLVDAATFASGAVDNSTTQLSGGAIIVKDGGVTMAKLESATNGQLPIGNGTGFTKATLTAGSNISITNASGAITIAVTGINASTVAYATAQTDNATDTFADATGMSVTATTGETYILESFLYYSTPGTSSSYDGKFQLTGTATASSIQGVTFAEVGASSVRSLAAGTSLPCDPVAGQAGIRGTLVHSILYIVCNGTGTLKWQFALYGATGMTVSIKRGSFMRLTRVA